MKINPNLSFTILVLLFFGKIGGQTQLSQIQWLTGTWCQVKNNKTTCERWEKVDENTLRGTSFAVRNADTVILENLMIQQIGDKLVYLAMPNGQNPAAFFLKEPPLATLVFENLEHDFPQRVIYEKPEKDLLRARIEGTEKGKTRTFSFEWKKVNPAILAQPLKFETVMENKKKVTGVGGIFFKCQDPEKMRNWYAENLGLVTNEYGSLFEFRDTDAPEKKQYLQWSPFTENTNYFQPSQKEFMINYRVQNLEWLVDELRGAGVTICDEIATYDYGKFVHIMDPEGNKIELWEPIDSDFTRSFDGKTTH